MFSSAFSSRQILKDRKRRSYSSSIFIFSSLPSISALVESLDLFEGDEAGGEEELVLPTLLEEVDFVGSAGVDEAAVA